jgi:excisionase family DNA binding protein
MPAHQGCGDGSRPARPEEESALLDVIGAAAYLGVTVAFVRRLVLERRVRYFKLGKFVRFRTGGLDAFVEAGRHEPVAPWVHTRSTQRRATARRSRQGGPGSGSTPPGGDTTPVPVGPTRT